MMSSLTRWLRRWPQRDDQHLVKRAAPETADPVDELRRIINETQERDAEDELRPLQFFEPPDLPPWWRWIAVR
jgi:hypothetical protein